MSVSGSSASRKRSWATIRFADESSTSLPRKTIRSRSRREKMSNERSKRPSVSTTIGTRCCTAASSTGKVQPISCTNIAQLVGCVSREGGAVQVEREIVFPASPAEVWEALTEPERLEEWFATEVELDPRPGGEGTFRWGNGEERHATVREADEEERLVLDWDDDGGEVVLELEEVEGGTLLHVVESSPDWSTALELHALAWVAVA